jgi:hypothetical protein
MKYSRRHFVRIVPALGAFALPMFVGTTDVGSRAAEASGQAPPPLDPVWPSPEPARGTPADESFPSQHPSLAKEVVGVSHGNLARVRELVQQHPSLAKASWDWGYGDWETALGAASHTGRREIAELLLENGAPATLCSATMLGQLDVVKAFLAAMPGGQRIRGPHSLSLMVHAKAGGPPAASVVRYFESLGDADLPMRDEPIATEDRAQVQGRYRFGDGPRGSFVIDTQQGALGIQRPWATRRNLLHLGSLEFHPAGAPAVRIRFEREGSNVVALTLSDPDLVVRARRS